MPIKEQIKIKNREYYLNNREIILNRVKENSINNKEAINKYQNNYRENHREKAATYSREHYKNNKSEVLKKRKIYVANNRPKINKYLKNKKREDIVFKLKANLRTYIANIFKRNGYTKNSKLTEILGCSYDIYCNHIESQWELWMNWDNYGKYNGTEEYGWDIDHIKPLSLGKTCDETLKLFHYTNTKPLCSKINRNVKRDKY